ncbi:LysR family transcriptional regulator [Vibrio sp. WXL210]|uniref:LysR family transcriptional regulator n=1 Tax=Vibrio sp. WXL210 TaxID=3450709 RepID=UPI003EC79BED
MRQVEGLSLFAKVVELKSFSEAARQLNLPTTTVSRHIQQLEQALGGRLLNRTTRALALTELGERVLPKAMLINEILREVEHEAEQASSVPTGHLHISAPRALSQSVIAPLISEFHHQYPTISVELDTTNRIQELTKTKVDFAFRVGVLPDSSLRALLLAEVDFELVAGPQWVANNKPLKHPGQLAQHNTIRNQIDGYILPWQFSREGEEFLYQGEHKLISDDLSVSLVYAQQNVGVAYLPINLVKPSLQDGRLVPLLSDWSKPATPLHLLYPQRSDMPLKSKCFIDFVRQHRERFAAQLTKGE